MSRWTALLLFPFLPAPAARRLQGSRVAVALPLLFAVLVGGFFVVAGAGTNDAVAVGLTYARYVYGLALGGTVFGILALRVAQREATWKDLVGPACAAAAWLPFAFVTLLGIADALGAGAAAGLYAGLLVLLWGAAAGMGAIAGEEAPEPGRLLVATCLGLTGCLLGLGAMHRVPPLVPVTAVRAPFDGRIVRQGNILLVRSDPDARGPCVVLLREAGTEEAVFVFLAPNGNRTVLGDVTLQPKMLQDWNIAGRVFFRLGGPGGWSVVGTEQTPKMPQD